ncbi:MAG: hypothetical protein KF851_18730 [Pirellulaceae bacterium]|jgi:hypothetical protein|nr:hypothetical protein [Pirellulaceae bacterium]
MPHTNCQYLVICRWLIPIALVGLLGGCRGYHMGNQYLFRNDIRSIHVQFVEADSYRWFQGQLLTEALVKEVENATPYVLSEPAVADSFLQVRLIQEQKRIAGRTGFNDPRVIEFDWQVEATWVDRAGVPLMNRQLIRVGDESTFIPEGGQSLGSAQLALVEQMARQIVGQMEAAW